MGFLECFFFSQKFKSVLELNYP
uniref:Uncharacterized protein n=1 Tax=Anguilla anguilla TaxID=7936 RepID=A0A0E9SXJ8_ANGAN